MRRLIINADDFGLTSGVNRGIRDAHTNGVVTSSTLMTCGGRFEEAVGFASETPKLSVGCHVVLVDGFPTLRDVNASSLTVTNDGAEPRFRESLLSFAGLATAGRLDESEIEAEITAQIRKLQAAGIPVSHLDSHKHTHMFPVVFRAALRAARNCGVRAMRNPFEPLLFASGGSWKRRFQLRVLRSYRAKFREELAKSGLITPDGCIGIITTGGLKLETFSLLIDSLPDGTWEFVSHPGYNDAELGQVKTRLRSSREQELAILTSPAAKELLRRAEIQLISYHDLVENQPSLA